MSSSGGGRITTESWSEIYRPKTIDEIVGQENLKTLLNDYLNRDDFPNLLQHGPPGVGKTSAVHAFARQYYGEHFKHNFSERNASDERGIDIIRGEIKNFTRHAPHGPFKFRFMFLDEIDGLTKDAQAALNRTLESAHRTCKFWASCNNPSKLIPALFSRFVKFYVGPLSEEEIELCLIQICSVEGRHADQDAFVKINNYVKGDLRQAIQILQALPLEGVTDLNLLDSLCPYPSQDEVNGVIEQIMEGEYINFSHPQPKELLELVYDAFLRKTHPLQPQILDSIAEYSYRLSQPCNPRMQMNACFRRIQQIVGSV